MYKYILHVFPVQKDTFSMISVILLFFHNYVLHNYIICMIFITNKIVKQFFIECNIILFVKFNVARPGKLNLN